MDIIISANDLVLKIIKNVKDEIEYLHNENIKVFLEEIFQEKQDEINSIYKCSQYNYHVENEKEHLIYNTLYNSLVRMNREEYKEYLFCKTSNFLLEEEFVRNGFWINEEIDERKRYLTIAHIFTKYLKRPINLTITSTLKCNARCEYCYERGVLQKDLDSTSFEKIINFIKLKDYSMGVNLNWFGGEPLMNISALDYISEKLIENNISFKSYVITNGSLLNRNILDNKLEKWKVHDIQITLDGTKLEYEKRKNYKNKKEGEYYRILDNILNVAEKGICVHLRLNIDLKNVENIYFLLEELEHIFANYDNVVFYPAFISGCTENLTEEQKIEVIKNMLDKLKNPRKLTTGTKLYSYPKIHACMKRDPNSFTIDVNEKIYDCEHLVGKTENAIGSLDIGIYQKDTRASKTILREECYNCVFLPKCMGGCEANYLSNDNPCMIEKYIIMGYLKLLLEKR